MSIRKSLVGQKFGGLTVIALAEPRLIGGRFRICWECECECGNRRVVAREKLIAKVGMRTVSCKCWQGKKTFPGTTYSQAHKILAVYVQGARKRGLDWLLSEEAGIKLLAGECYYCGAMPSPAPKSLANKQTRKDGFAYNGIDRLAPTEGYIAGNCVSCCSICNYFKGGRTEEEFIRQVTKIYRHIVSK